MIKDFCLQDLVTHFIFNEQYYVRADIILLLQC